MEVNKYLNNIRMWPCYNPHSRLLCANFEAVKKYLNKNKNKNWRGGEEIYEQE